MRISDWSSDVCSSDLRPCSCATSGRRDISHAEGRIMMFLSEYRERSERLADYLPWAALVAPGVVLNKDGSFQRVLAFRGPDLQSATEAELVSACARANNALRRFGSGWALFFQAERRESHRYPASDFPDAASWLVDRERRAAFEAEGAHFERRYRSERRVGKECVSTCSCRWSPDH